MKKNIGKGIGWTIFSSLVIILIQISQLVIFSRYLTKEEFGLVSLVIVIIGLVQIFVDCGISNAIVSKSEVIKEEIDSLFWLTLISGLFLFLLLNLFSHYISSFFENNVIEDLITILSFSILCGGAGSLYKSLFQKNLKFNYMAKMDIFSIILSFSITLSLLYFKCGVYSVVIGSLVASVLSSILYTIRGMNFYGLPEYRIRKKDISYYWSYGKYQISERILIYLNAHLDIIVIGKAMTIDSVGVYSIAKQIVMKVSIFFNLIITRVTLPILSLNKGEKNLAKENFKLSISLLSIFMAPAFTIVALNSEIIIKIIFGNQWLSAVMVIKLLCIYFFFRTLSSPVGSLVLSVDKPYLTFYWNLVTIFITPGFIYYFSLIGLKELCLYFILYSILIKIPEYFLLIKRIVDISFIDYFFINFKNFFISIFIVLFLHSFFDLNDSIIFSVIYLLIYLLLSFIIDFSKIKLIIYTFKQD